MTTAAALTRSAADPFDRSKGLGATDARRIMAGEWHDLWQIKTCRVPEPDLSRNFAVQLGLTTEDLHRRWLNLIHGLDVIAHDRVHTILPGHGRFGATPLYVTPDGYAREVLSFVEMKHTYAGRSLPEVAGYYAAQLQHNMLVTGAKRVLLSIITGNEEPEFGFVDRSPEYLATLTDMLRRFWWHVEQDVAPEIIPTDTLAKAEKRIPLIPVNGTREVDMAGSNHWASLSAEFIELKPHATRFDAVSKELKGLVEQDVRRAFGAGLAVVRDKAGRLSVRIDKEK